MTRAIPTGQSGRGAWKPAYTENALLNKESGCLPPLGSLDAKRLGRILHEPAGLSPRKPSKVILSFLPGIFRDFGGVYNSFQLYSDNCMALVVKKITNNHVFLVFSFFCHSCENRNPVSVIANTFLCALAHPLG